MPVTSSTSWADLVSVDDSGDVHVHDAAYTSSAVFDAEMREIFESGWVYIAHESEIPAAGDYKTAIIGVQPVVVTRHEDGNVHVLLNRCRHRGMVVCRAATGHSHYLRCAYHNWTYAGDGTLVGVAEADGYPEDFDKSAFGLARIAQIVVHAGFIFGTLSMDAPSAENHLAAVRPVLDGWLSRLGSTGISLAPAVRKECHPVNWKRVVEQAPEWTLLFPNLWLTGDGVAVVVPTGADRTELSRHAYLTADAEDERNETRTDLWPMPEGRCRGSGPNATEQAFYVEWKQRMTP